MKKISKLLLCAFVLVCGLFIAACGGQNGSAGRLVLSKDQVVIYVGETEDNTETVNVKLVDINVNSLSLRYDTSKIKVTSSAKLSDGSFDLYITPKTELQVDEVIVTVLAGANVSASFSVTVVVPITNIIAPDDLYIAFNGEVTSMSFADNITFEPGGSTGDGVTYQILNGDSFVDTVAIVNGRLVLASTFNNFDEDIVVRAQSNHTVGGNSIFTDFNVKVIPNVRYVADAIEMKVNYNGGNGQNIDENGYYLQIDQNVLEDFQIEVKIPNSLGVEVDVDSSKNEQENIMSYLRYDRIISQSETDSKTYTFVFESYNLKPTRAVGLLYFKFYYTDHSNNSVLTANFVKCVNQSNQPVLKDYLPINIVVPISAIQVTTDAELLPDNSYLIYENYGNSLYGSMFIFNPVPANASDRVFKIKSMLNIDVYILNGQNVYSKLFEDDLFTAGDTLYICASTNRTSETPRLVVESESVFNVEPKTLFFTVSFGASDFGFTEDAVESPAVKEKQVAVKLGGESSGATSLRLYAPGASVGDLVFDDDEYITVSADVVPNYFNIEVLPKEVGVRRYTFRTRNGFEATLSVETIQIINDVKVAISGSSSDVSGVGLVEYDNEESLKKVSIKFGYAIPLSYIYDEGANIRNITYSFVDAVLGDEEYTSAYSESYKNFALEGFEDTSFKNLSLVVNAQDIKEANIITTTRVGKVYVKIDIYGNEVNRRGEIIQAQAITKYVLVEIYRPIKDIESSEKVVELRAQNQLVAADYSNATTMVLVNGVASGGNVATYNRVYINNGRLEEVIENTETTKYIIYEFDDKAKFNATLNIQTNELTITVVEVPSDFNYDKDFLRLVLFVVDFNDIVSETSFISLDTYSNNDSIKTYEIFIKVTRTKAVENVEVTSLRLLSEDNESKTYEEIYIDVSTLSVTDTNVYNIFTKVTPIDAFNKNLVYTFVPDTGYTPSLIDVSENNGRVYIPGTVGGTGKIVITPQYTDSTVSVKRIIIPITIADGNSYNTAFRISNLLQIGNLSKHYKIVSNETLVLNSTLFVGEVFNGGLYGISEAHDIPATLCLDDCSLFDAIGSRAIIKDLVVYGTSNAQGMIANTNSGLIENVEITSYIKNGNYIPSLVRFEGNGSVGGVVGTNNGTLRNCSFLGTIASKNENIIGEGNVIKTGLYGINNGTIEDCSLIVARFNDCMEAIGRTIQVNDGGTLNTINGIMFIDNSHEDINLEAQEYVDLISYSDVGNQLDGTGYVNTVERHSIGDSSSRYGVVFYYEAKDSTKQNGLSTHNTIAVEDLVYTNLGSSIKVLALDQLGINSRIVSVVGNTIHINSIGEFDLIVYSKYDYTQSITLHMVSLYFIDEFRFVEGIEKLEKGSEIKILVGGSSVISSAGRVVVDGIELKQNDFNIAFFMFNDEEDLNDWQNIIDATNYVTGTTLGNHTIHATWNREEITKILSAKIYSAYSEVYNDIINNYFLKVESELGSGTREYYFVKLVLSRGTTNVGVSASEGSIEPKDTFVFDASITTDMPTDKVIKENIRIENQYDYDVTNAFDISVGGRRLTANSNVYSFEIVIGLKSEYRHSLNYVDKTYRVKVYACSEDGEIVYSTFGRMQLTILPQTLTSVHSAMYEQVSGYSSGGTDYSVVSWTNPTSVIKPTGRALLVVDLYPNYATLDYIDIVATSNTLAQLAYRIQRKEGDVYTFDNNARYQVLDDVNGIRINNNLSENSDLVQDIGTYYIIIFPTNTLNQDAIININISAYYKGVKLEKESNITLYVKAPAVPQISIDGQTSIYAYMGETLTARANISYDQTIKKVYLTDNNGTVLDSILVEFEEIEGSNVGYRQYKLTFTIPFDGENGFAFNQSKIPLNLYVESEKIEKGEHITAKSAPIFIYITPFGVVDNSIQIKDVNEGKLEVNSIKPKMLELYTNFNHGENEDVLSAIAEFNANYYYKLSTSGGASENIVFELGNDNGGAAYNLVSYLYYLNGNQAYSIGRVINGINGKEFVAVEDPQYNDIVTFGISGEKLYVMGGDRVGQVPMLLRLYRTMPDGAQYVYEYYFTISNSLYTTEDMPIEISDAESFKTMNNSEKANHYILSNNIYLYDYDVNESMPNTSKIKSFDGNNYTINIVSFKEPTTTSATFALFNTISSGTTIKNVTVNYYYLPEINLGEDIIRVDIAGLAITNSGVVYNTEVMAFASGERSPTFTTYGLKVTTLNTNVTVNAAGMVMTNNGSITNSRVGGDSKLVSSFVYPTSSDNFVKPTLRTNETKAKTFTIRAGGTVSGFVIKNNTGAVISSSFAKNINVINTYDRNQTMVTTGFVNTNDGAISMCYVEGVGNDVDIQAMNGGIEGNGILAGFVYDNTNTIADCYSNIMIKTTSNQVGRLGAGFVYQNELTGEVLRSYSFSSIAGNNISQLSFIGVNDLMEYNNRGLIKSCYYYSTDVMDLTLLDPVYNTEVEPVKNVNSSFNFYGFSFGSSSNDLRATWKISTKGPRLVSADDITHSIRYKADNNGSVSKTSSLAYVFVYDNDYEYGTVNNPIIIRDAKEFNDVFGGTETVFADNIENGKAFGSYRLVNNINLNELIIDDQEVETTDYKYSLTSTDVSLTGQYRYLSDRPGLLDGNGLTISHLAISNPSKTSSQNYGMFKTIENGAGIKNLNIGLDTGGVNADHTVNVGTIAGTLTDSILVNVRVYAMNAMDKPTVVGANIVGGVVGRVAGDCYIAGVTVENVSVTATYNQSESFNALQLTNNTPNMEGTGLATLSIAGGAFGILDLFTQKQFVSRRVIANTDLREANVQGLSVKGIETITAMTVGGVAGYIGTFVVAKDLSFTVSRGAKLIAYNCFAGGVVGFNCGYLYQIKAEHEETWQKDIEQNIQTYYKSNLDYDRGELKLFEVDGEETLYRPNTIGGLVGVMHRGIIDVGYSKINVRNSTVKYAGGVIGLVNPTYITDESSDEYYQIQINEVYATGDVYAGASDSYMGGVIGLNKFSVLDIKKVASLNVWSKETISVSDSGKHIAQIAFDNSVHIEESGNAYSNGSNINYSSVSALYNGWKPGSGEGIYDVDGTRTTVVFNDSTNKTIPVFVKTNNDDINTNLSVDAVTIPSYYNYAGLSSDGGAQVDTAFKQTGWYSASNWIKKTDSLYPAIRYVESVNVFIISTVDDFDLIRRYGGNPDSQFVIVNNIDCRRIKISYPVLRGTLMGLNDSITLTKLSVPLVKTLNGAEICGINLEDFSAPIANEAINGTFIHDLIYRNCGFSSVSSSVAGTYDIAGVVFQADNTIFQTIEFQNCYLKIEPIADKNVKNAGLLFACGKAGGTVDIRNISINSGCYIGNNDTSTSNIKPVNNEANIGLIFGESKASATNINNASVKGKVIVSLPQSETSSQESNIGLICGHVENITTISNASVSSGVVYVKCNNGNQVLNVGGFVGKASSSVIVVYDSFAGSSTGCDVTVIGVYNAIHVGGMVGRANSFEYSSGIELVFGRKASNDYNRIYVDSPAGATSAFVGGACGYTEKMSSSDNGIDTPAGGALIYNGNITINQAQISDVGAKMYIGGIVGQIKPATPGEDMSAKKLIFGGTISFEYKNAVTNQTTYYVGGLFGAITNANYSINVDSAYVFGDILLENTTSSLSAIKYDLITTAKSYFGGVVGQVGANTTLNLTNSIGLATLYSKHNNEHVFDAVAIKENNTSEIDCESDGVVKTFYASNLNLCVSETAAVNTAFGSLNTWLGGFSQIFEEGTKLNPYVYDISMNINSHSSEGDGYSAEVENGCQKLRGTISDGRKTYFYLSEDITAGQSFANRISLFNIGFFADGQSITTNFVPFENIDGTSFVSGVKSRIYADETELDKNVSLAGFANTNDGVVYTCSAEETLVDYEDLDATNFNSVKTQFYGYLKTDASIVAGFIHTNNGYVFGSYSNMNIVSTYSKNNFGSISGFIYKNSGTVEYSYAMGYAEIGSLTEVTRNIDLFIIDGGNVNVINCYTTFATAYDSNGVATISHNANTGCLYEKDACETILSHNSTALCGEYTDKYYKCDANYNSNYPTLSDGPFAELSYTKRLTMLNKTQKTVIESGKKTNWDYYYVSETGNAGEYGVINTITALSKVANDGKYVISRSLNFGYVVDNVNRNSSGALGYTPKNGSSDTLAYELCQTSETTLIGTTPEEINGDGKTVYNVTLAEGSCLIGTIKTGATLKNLTFTNVNVFGSGVPIKTNSGTIDNVNLTGEVKYTGGTSAGQYVSALIGQNEGLIINSKVSLTSLTGAGATNNYTFGTFVGKNMGTVGQKNGNKWERVDATMSSVIIVETTANLEVTFGGIVGYNTNGGMVSGCGIIDKADINVIADVVCVGGIVGEADSGTVSNCYTVESSTIAGGSEDLGSVSVDSVELNIPAGTSSHVGGIVGTGSGSLKITDCSNGANVTAKARWEFAEKTENSNSIRKNRYKYNSRYEVVYVLNLGTSEAYAGGIISNYSNINSAESTRLKNTGVVSGGFKAWKPIVALTTRSDSFFRGLLTAGIYVGALGLAAGAGAAMGAVAAANFWNPVGWVLLVLAIGSVAQSAYEYYQSTICYLNYCPMPGNSNNVNQLSTDGALQHIFPATSSGVAYITGAKDFQLQDFMDNPLVPEMNEIRYKGKIDDVNNTCFIESTKMYFGDATKGAGVTNEEADKILHEIYYDGIAPDIKSNNLTIESDTSNYKEESGKFKVKKNVTINTEALKTGERLKVLTLNTSDENNSKLTFFYGDEYGNSIKYGTANDATLANEFDVNNTKPLLNNYTGNSSAWSNGWSDGELDTVNPDIFVPINENAENVGTKEHPYLFLLTDPLTWRELAYTINNTKYGGLEQYNKYDGWFDGEGDINNHSTIIISAKNNTVIEVAGNVLDRYNGTITLTNFASAFGGMKLNITNNTNYGLIRKTKDLVVNSFNYKGDVELSYHKKLTPELDDSNKYNSNFGLLVGEVVAGGKLTVNERNRNGYVQIDSLLISNEVVNRFVNISGLVGCANGQVKIKNEVITISEFRQEGYLISAGAGGSRVNCSFGGVIGSIVGSGNADLQSVDFTGIDIKLQTSTNCVGGIVGANLNTGASRSLKITDSHVNLEEFMAVSFETDVYVGGVIGLNKGTTTITEPIIQFFSESLTISADVADGTQSAFAGGIVGANLASANSLEYSGAKIYGSNGYASGYILAGYNKVSNTNVYVLPSKAYAGKYIGHGNANEGLGMSSIYVIVRSVAINNSSSIHISLADTNKFNSGSENNDIILKSATIMDIRANNDLWTYEVAGVKTDPPNALRNGTSSGYVKEQINSYGFQMGTTNTDGYTYGPEIPSGSSVTINRNLSSYGFNVQKITDGSNISSIISFSKDNIPVQGSSNTCKYYNKNTVKLSNINSHYNYENDSNDFATVYEANITFESEYDYRWYENDEEKTLNGKIVTQYKFVVTRVNSSIDSNNGKYMLNIIFVDFSTDSYPEQNGRNDFIDITMPYSLNSVIYSTFLNNNMKEEIPNLNVGLGAGLMTYVFEKVGTHNSADVNVSKTTSLRPQNMYIAFNNGELTINEGIKVDESTFGLWDQNLTNNKQCHWILEVNADYERTIAKVTLEDADSTTFNRVSIGSSEDWVDIYADDDLTKELDIVDGSNNTIEINPIGDDGFMYKGYYVSKSLYNGKYFSAQFQQESSQDITDIGIDVYYKSIGAKTYVIVSNYNLRTVTSTDHGSTYNYDVKDCVYEYNDTIKKYGLKATLSYQLETLADKANMYNVIGNRYDSFVPVVPISSKMSCLNVVYKKNGHDYNLGENGSFAIPGVKFVIPTKLTLNYIYGDSSLTCANCKMYDILITYNNTEFTTALSLNNDGDVNIKYSAVRFSDVKYIKTPLGVIYNQYEEDLINNCGVIQGKYVLKKDGYTDEIPDEIPDENTDKKYYLWGDDELITVAYLIENNQVVPGAGDNELYYVYINGSSIEWVGTDSIAVRFYTFK